MSHHIIYDLTRIETCPSHVWCGNEAWISISFQPIVLEVRVKSIFQVVVPNVFCSQSKYPQTWSQLSPIDIDLVSCAAAHHHPFPSRARHHHHHQKKSIIFHAQLPYPALPFPQPLTTQPHTLLCSAHNNTQPPRQCRPNKTHLVKTFTPSASATLTPGSPCVTYSCRQRSGGWVDWKIIEMQCVTITLFLPGRHNQIWWTN